MTSSSNAQEHGFIRALRRHRELRFSAGGILHGNPVQARLAAIPSDYPYSSANLRLELDLPTSAKAEVSLGPATHG
jgi:hypothetical protein